MQNSKIQYPIFAEISAGAVIYKREGSSILIGVIHRKKMNDYCLPKGHQETGESLQQTVLREVLEETGWAVTVRDFVKQMMYKVVNGDKKIEYWRNVYWFLAEAEKETTTFADLEEVDELKWISIENAKKLLTYDNEKEILDLAVTSIKAENNAN